MHLDEGAAAQLAANADGQRFQELSTIRSIMYYAKHGDDPSYCGPESEVAHSSMSRVEFFVEISITWICICYDDKISGRDSKNHHKRPWTISMHATALGCVCLMQVMLQNGGHGHTAPAGTCYLAKASTFQSVLFFIYSTFATLGPE